MAKFTVTTPNGTYEVTAPNNATDEEVYTYVKTHLGDYPKTIVSEVDYGVSNTSEDAIGSGQFFLEMIVGAVVLAVIISLYKVHNLMWIPVVGFLIGYLMSQDTSYVFSNVFGGLTFSMLCSIIAGIWIQRQKKKGE